MSSLLESSFVRYELPIPNHKKRTPRFLLEKLLKKTCRFCNITEEKRTPRFLVEKLNYSVFRVKNVMLRFLSEKLNVFFFQNLNLLFLSYYDEIQYFDSCAELLKVSRIS